MKFMRRFTAASILALAFAACGGPPAPQLPDPGLPPIAGGEPGDRVEILWDTWGIPHIFARDAAAAFFAFGWSQMHSHGDLVLQLYAQARGRAAEYWGDRFLDGDRWVRVNDVPRRAGEWLAAQPPHIRSFIDAFVAGMNSYAARHPEQIGEAYRVVLPVTAEDVMAHMQRTILFTFVASPPMVTQGARAIGATGGSNGWAIAPSRSASGNAMLLANPHLPWGDLFTWYEAQVVVGDMNAYGVALIGHPTLGIAFNDYLGWTNTVNTYDGADLYELTIAGDGYMFDGQVQPFRVRYDTIRVRGTDGSLSATLLPVIQSVHGPVVARQGNRALALRVAGLDATGAIEQFWDLMHARDRISFETALARLQVPMFTYLYADRDGHILHVFNGRVPQRPRGDFAYWAGIVPGDSSSTLWVSTHTYPELPRVLDPPTGWLQNANDPPWSTTIPWAIDPSRYPRYIAPRRSMSLRAQRSARMLAEDASITFEELVRYKHSTRMEAADHLLEDLIAAVRAGATDSLTVAAAGVLEAWDRTADANSRGAVLFAEFFRELPRPGIFDVPWSEEAPLTTPDGLADPAAAVRALTRAAARVRQTWGRIDVAWGDVHRFRYGDVDLPANGGPGGLGIFRVIEYDNATDNRRVASSGDSWVAAIEFGDTVVARALLSYGNASQPGTTHRTDQLPLLARKELREVWRTREEVLANLERRESF